MIFRIRRRRDEEGVALIIAVAIATIFITISASLALTVMNNVGSVERGVLSASSSQSATAGLNYAISTISTDLSTSASTYPCTLTGTTSASSNGQVKEAYTVALTYYSSVNSAASPPTASGALTCTSGSISSSASIAAVGISDTGTAGGGKTSTTKISALFSITAGSTFAGGYGIFDDSSGVFNNSMGATTNTGTIYINGPMQCNSATINGPVFVNDPSDLGASGIGNPSNAAAYLENSCKINGTLAVNGDVQTTTSSPNVTGNATVVGGVTMGNPGNPIFSGKLTASGTVSPSSGTNYTTQYVGGTLTQNGTATLPTAPSMPVLTFSSSSWTSAGWTVDTNNTCTPSWQNPTPTPTSGIYYELLTDAALTTPTVLFTDCPIQLPQNVTIQFKSNFALVDTSTSGMIFNADTLESSSSTVHDLYLIIPSDPLSPASPSFVTCNSNYEIQGENQESFGVATTNPLDVFIYDPCDVSFTNNGTFTGQMVVGGFGSLTNQFDFTYVNPGTPPGAANSQGSLTPLDQYVLSSS